MSEANGPDVREEDRRTLMAMTAAERQRLHRMRKRNGAVDASGVVTDRDTGQPSLAVTRVAKNLQAGMSDRGALRAAGSSEKATQLLDKAKAALAQTLIEQGGHWPRLVEHAVKSLGRTKKMQVGLECIDVPDTIDQREARRDLWEWNDQAGELPAKTQQHGGGNILNYTLNLYPLSQIAPPELIVADSPHTEATEALMNGRVIDAQSLARTDDDEG